MPRRKNETNYCAARNGKRSHRGKPLLDLAAFDHPPAVEVEAMLALMDAGELTAASARELIDFPPRMRFELRRAGVSRHLIRKAACFREKVLAAFEYELAHPTEIKRDAASPCTRKSLVPWSRRRRPNVKIIDMLRPRTQAPEANSQVDGRDVRDIIAEERVCWSCGRLPSTRVLDDHGYCLLCFRSEMAMRAAG